MRMEKIICDGKEFAVLPLVKLQKKKFPDIFAFLLAQTNTLTKIYDLHGRKLRRR